MLQVLERASSRRSLSADHTVVGFFGATGSGKSSLFNAVSGDEIATAAVRRPTTSEPLAGVWGADGSEALLDWLEVRKRTMPQPVPGFADEDTGLILLDLPDFDSTRAANREIVQRMVGLVDVLVWVLDPQKYADAAVHNDFLAPLASHGAVTLVVLNQIDRLPEQDVRPVLESLKDILARDGLGKVQVLGASALTGTGVDKVRAAIRQAAVQRQAMSQRLAADVPRPPARLADGLRTRRKPAGVRAGGRGRALAEELAVAANVPLVVDAVARSYRHGGHPAHRLARDPLAGPVPAGSAAAAEPAPRGRQCRGQPDFAAARRSAGAGPDRCCRPGIRRGGLRRCARAVAGGHPRRGP